MIFSFSDRASSDTKPEIINTDIFCFFHWENAVKVPEEFWLHAVITSLKIKKNVLILTETMPFLPTLNFTQRWQIGDDFLYLAPRSLSVLFEAVNANSNSYPSIKAFLAHYK